MSLTLRQFSPDGKYFAYIGQQGKFVVYDVEASAVHQVYTPNLHLNAPCTSFAWIQTGNNERTTPKGKSKKSRLSLAGQLLVAFGTSKGGVAFYSLATGSIEHTCKGDGHTAPITAIYFNAEHDSDRIYTAGADGKVIEWSVSKCAQRKVHKIGVEKLTCVMAHAGSILTGAKQLTLWDRESDQTVRTLVGHTSNTQLLHPIIVGVDEDAVVYALSGSANDRNLSLWSITGEEKNPIAYFALDDVPEYLSPKLVGNKLHLVAVSRTGVSHYFVRDMGKLSTKKPYKASHMFEVAIDSTGQETKVVDRLPVFVATVQYSPQQEQILLGYGTEAHLRFEQVTIEDDVKWNVIIREPVKLITGKAKDGDLKTKTPLVEDAEYLNPVNANKKSVKKVEIPMEVRLENLSLLPDRSGTKTKSGQKNMIHLLVQGLHSKDADLLRLVFSNNDPEVIQQTIQRMPSQYVSALLNELSHMMQMKTMHVQTAVCWLKHLISIHSSQMMALGSSNLLGEFATCLGIIEYRVEHLNSLSRLRGRLGLLLEQIDRNKQTVTPEDQANTNVLVYQEGDDSDVDSMLGKEGIEQPESSNEDMYDDEDVDDVDDDDDNEEYDEDKMSANRNGTTPLLRQNGHGVHEKDASDDDESEMEVSD